MATKVIEVRNSLTREDALYKLLAEVSKDQNADDLIPGTITIRTDSSGPAHFAYFIARWEAYGY